MGLLNGLGIAYTGVSEKSAETKKFITIERKGIRIGIYSATYGLNFSKPKHLKQVKINQLNGIAPPDSLELDLAEIHSVIRQMNADSIDFKVISIHWGFEFELYPDAFIQRVAKQIVLAGADMVLGGHPHVFQPLEAVYLNNYNINTNEDLMPCPSRLIDSTGINRKALIIYSLGNFVTRMYTPACKVGAIAGIWLVKDSVTKRIDWQIGNIEFVYNHAPSVPSKSHRLMFWNDYKNKYLLKSSKKNNEIKSEVDAMIGHISKPRKKSL